MDPLTRIKRLVLSGHVRFTEKTRDEMDADDLTLLDVVESIMTAQRIDKVLRSRSSLRKQSNEKLYVIKSLSYDGTPI